MMKRKSGSQIGLLPYIIVFLMIFCMGTPFGDNNSSTLRIVILILLIYGSFIKQKWIVNRSSSYIVLALIAIPVISMVLNLDSDIEGYIGLFIIIIACWIFMNFYSIKDFKNILADIMLVINVYSIILYAVGYIYPAFVHMLPTYWGGQLRHLLYMYYYNDTSFYYEGTLSYIRNMSMFREAGFYQIFINLAIFCEFTKEQKINHVRIWIHFIALFTTFSSGGIIAGIPLMLLYARKARYISKRSRNILYVIVFLLAVVYAYIIYSNSDALFLNKLSGGSASASSEDRITCLLSDLNLFFSSPIWGVGYTGFSTGVGTECGFTCAAALFGICYPVMLFIGIYGFCKDGTLTKWELWYGFLSIVVAQSSQSAILIPASMMMVLYGLVYIFGNRKDVASGNLNEENFDGEEHYINNRSSV